MKILRYSSPRKWFRGLWTNCVHTGTGSVLAAFGTNGAEMLAPDALQGIGLDLRQIVSVFFVSTVFAAFKFVHATTQPTETALPFEPQPPLRRS